MCRCGLSAVDVPSRALCSPSSMVPVDCFTTHLPHTPGDGGDARGGAVRGPRLARVDAQGHAATGDLHIHRGNSGRSQGEVRSEEAAPPASGGHALRALTERGAVLQERETGRLRRGRRRDWRRTARRCCSESLHAFRRRRHPLLWGGAIGGGRTQQPRRGRQHTPGSSGKH